MSILEKNWLMEDKKNFLLSEVLTTKEIENIYGLPINTVIQDIRRGKVNYKHCRQSSKTWLMTRQEANRLYSGYRSKKIKADQFTH